MLNQTLLIVNFNSVDEVAASTGRNILAIGRANEFVRWNFQGRDEIWLNSMRGREYNNSHFSIRIAEQALNNLNRLYQDINDSNISSFVIVAHNFLLESLETGKPFIAITSDDDLMRFKIISL